MRLVAVPFRLCFGIDSTPQAAWLIDLSSGLENRRWATILEFESLRFRHYFQQKPRLFGAFVFLGLAQGCGHPLHAAGAKSGPGVHPWKLRGPVRASSRVNPFLQVPTGHKRELYLHERACLRSGQTANESFRVSMPRPRHSGTLRQADNARVQRALALRHSPLHPCFRHHAPSTPSES